MNKASVFEIDPTLSRGAHVAFKESLRTLFRSGTIENMNKRVVLSDI